MALLGYGLYNLEKITPGICKERNTKPIAGYVVWLAGDRHGAALQFVDDSVDTIDAETRMAPARHFVAVMQVRISGRFAAPCPTISSK